MRLPSFICWFFGGFMGGCIFWVFEKGALDKTHFFVSVGQAAVIALVSSLVLPKKYLIKLKD